MIVAILLFLLSTLCLIIGGYCRGIFECVLIFDSVKLLEGEDWSRELFFASKDVNNDNKISWFESTFPKDNTHHIKRMEMLFYGLASALFAASLWFVALPLVFIIVIALIYAPIYFAVTGYGFELSFKKYRP